MSQLVVNGVVTISNRDIADLIQSKYSDVKRPAERLVAAGILTASSTQLDFEHNGNVYQEYRLNKRGSLVIVARLSPEFTAAIVDRWQELEEGQSVSVPRSLSEVFRLAADLTEQKEQLTIQLAATAPKVGFANRYCSAEGSISFRQVAKLLNAEETELRLFFIERNILYRLGGTLTSMVQYISAGRLEVKTGTSSTLNHAFSQTRLTAKGIRWIGGLWTEHIAGGRAA